ncbi:MAG: YeeE/YedE family protein [Ignavibacteriaceae bacterium]|nr:YeeE/YedE family protein [Ignavibacteriaceae bacterium]
MSSISNDLNEKISSAAEEKAVKIPQPYWNPYLSGIGLGLVLLAAFVIMGRGLGASGAFSSLVAVGVDKVAPAHAQSNQFFKEYLGDGTNNPLKNWLVFEVLGVFVGGFISGALGGRIKKTTEKGERISIKGRLLFAFIGGGLMGFGAKLARGCTSGQALTGGALLNTGSWALMIMFFAGAYAAAYFIRRQWI